MARRDAEEKAREAAEAAGETAGAAQKAADHAQDPAGAARGAAAGAGEALVDEAELPTIIENAPSPNDLPTAQDLPAAVPESGGLPESPVADSTPAPGHDAIQAALREPPRAGPPPSSPEPTEPPALASSSPSAASPSAASQDAEAGGDGGPMSAVTMEFTTTQPEGSEWIVHQAELREALNEPYELHLTLQTRNLPLQADELLHADCVFTFRREDVVRRVPGIVREVDSGSQVNDSLTTQVVVVPALWLLGQRRNTRIFEQMTVPQIVEELLREGLEPYQRSWSVEVQEELPRRELTLQYDENNLDFLHRLLESEGLTYAFECEGDEAEKVVVVDDARHWGPAPLERGTTVPFGPGRSIAAIREELTALSRSSQLRPTSVALHQFDWTRPPLELAAQSADASAAGAGNGADVGEAREEYGPTGGATLWEYDDGDKRYTKEDLQRQAFLRRQLQIRDASMTVSGGTAIGFAPGRTFTATGAPLSNLDGDYRVVRIVHQLAADVGAESKQTLDYQHEATCIAADVDYRPARLTPGPRPPRLQTATVVGPDGEEDPGQSAGGDDIYTDEHGRVKVRFHWDRQEDRAMPQACWLRVMQPWAGPGWGTVFLPRVGSEVVVSFVNDNLDQPVVVGALFNGANPLPLTLPDQKTRTTWRSQTTPASDGGGYNELTFEDAADKEEIVLHAHRDYNQSVGQNRSVSVTGSDSTSVGGNQSVSVDGSQNVTVSGGGEAGGVTGASLNITGEYQLDASQEIRVQAPNKIELTCGGSTVTVEPNKITLSAGGGASVTLDAEVLAAAASGGQLQLTSDVQAQAQAGGSMKLDANAQMASSAGSSVVLDANAAMQSVPGSSLKLDSAANLASVAGSSVKLDAGAEVSGTAKAALTAPQAVVQGQVEATLQGGAGNVKADPTGVAAMGPMIRLN
jgi:type VI secretion system secreted protein VgrG